MRGLVFEEPSAVAPSAPNRADVACFVGFVRRRPGVGLPTAVRRWLDEQGWTSLPYARRPTEVDGLLDLPVPIDGWDLFDALFAWEQRMADTREWAGATYLGAAVRSFFAQGGRRCYVVRVGDPWSIISSRAERLSRIDRLIPGYPHAFACAPADRGGWRGLGHIFGLPDVSFVCVPDLPEAVASDPVPVDPSPPVPAPATEQWVECSALELPAPAPPDNFAAQARAPRCLDAAYKDWATAVSLIGMELTARAREVQLVAAVPMPFAQTAAAADLLRFLLANDGVPGPLAASPIEQADGLASAFIQLAYPWVRSAGSSDLPEQLESPDGVLVGVLARNALLNGAYRSAARQHLADVYAVQPELRRDQLLTAHPDSLGERATSHTLLDRISLLGRQPDGLALLSDVTTSRVESYRPASVSRLVAAIVRAARRFGDESVFDPSGPAVWTSLRQQLRGLLFGLLQDGALHGDTPDQAFEVRCDRGTMTQNDLDNGRLVAEIVFQAAMPIEGIRLVLALEAGGVVSTTAGLSGAAA